jgi:hypothetical protein
MTSGECFENKWFYMKSTGKYCSAEWLLTPDWWHARKYIFWIKFKLLVFLYFRLDMRDRHIFWAPVWNVTILFIDDLKTKFDSAAMHIKSMVVDGFKSYAQRTEINGFDPLFNAITGLNGSGKSNILDSICFLLGITNLAHVSCQYTYTDTI